MIPELLFVYYAVRFSLIMGLMGESPKFSELSLAGKIVVVVFTSAIVIGLAYFLLRKPPPSTDPDIGSVCRLDSGSAVVPAAVTPEAYDEFLKFLSAKDDIGIVGLHRAGKVVNLSSGTQAKVIDSTFWTFEVRILDGPEAERKLFVLRQHVKAPSRDSR